MPFKIEERTVDGLDVIHIQNLSGNEVFSILPYFGGAINEITLSKKGRLHTVHRASTGLKDYVANKLPMYSGSFMAPFPNRIRNGQYTFQLQKYQLPVNDRDYNCALHGFCYDQSFQVAQIDKKNGTVVLEFRFHGIEGYPFKFSITNTYRLYADHIEVYTRIVNDHSQEIPMGFGWHPYLDMNVKIDTLELKIPAKKYLSLDEQFIPNLQTCANTFSEYRLIGDLFMNDCYEMEADTVFVRDVASDLEIFLEQKTGKGGYNYCMFYTPPSRNALAIEPMTCAPNAFNNDMGLQKLPLGETIVASWKMGISQN